MNGGSPLPQPSPIKGEGIDVSFDGLRTNGSGWGFTLTPALSHNRPRMNGGSPLPQPSPIKGEGIDVSFDGLRTNGSGWGFTLTPALSHNRPRMSGGSPSPQALSHDRLRMSVGVTLTQALSHQGRGEPNPTWMNGMDRAAITARQVRGAGAWPPSPGSGVGLPQWGRYAILAAVRFRNFFAREGRLWTWV